MEISVEATPEEIKKAYRRLARRFHPDVSREADAEEKFKELQQAYNTLKDPIERGYYHQVREEAKNQKNYEPDHDAYRYWQSPPPPRQTIYRKVRHWLIIFFWFFFGISGTFLRRVSACMLHFLVFGLSRVAIYIGVFMVVLGFVFVGNPWVIHNLTTHPGASFTFFGVPSLALALGLLAHRVLEWLSDDEYPLFPSVSNWINGIRYRSLCL